MTEHKKGLIPTQDQASINRSNPADNNYIADMINSPLVDGQCADV